MVVWWCGGVVVWWCGSGGEESVLKKFSKNFQKVFKNFALFLAVGRGCMTFHLR